MKIVQHDVRVDDPALIDNHLKEMVGLGHVFWPAALPANLQLGRPGYCFENALIQAIHHKEYLYVEGIAVIGGEAYAHAWLTDQRQKFAFEVTWSVTDDKTGKVKNVPPPVIYKGIVLNTEACWDLSVKMRRFGIIANRERYPRRYAGILRRSGIKFA